MKSLYILYAVIFLLVFSTCKDDDMGGDLTGSEYIRGRLFLVDTLTQQATGTPLAKKKINIKYASSTDTLNYLFTTTTDDEGYFLFSNLKENTSYRLLYEETVNGILYMADSAATAPTDTMRLIARLADSRQNGIHIMTTDINGGVIKDVSICIFNSPSLGYTSGSCDGSNYTITSNAAGQAFQFGLPQGKYYLFATAKIKDLTLTVKDTLEINGQVKYDTLRFSLPNSNNGLQYTVLSPEGNPVSGAEICIFSGTNTGYLDNSCDGSNFQLTTDVSGKASRSAFTPGTYYLLIKDTVNKIPFMAKDTITIGNTVLNETIRLKAPNGILATALDAEGARLPGVDICIFTSGLLFQRDTCEGSNYQLKTNVQGTAAQYGLAPGRYFVLGTLKVGNDTWIGRDTVDVAELVEEPVLMLRRK
ncbi:carboxypeptidase-like regulatory domain-containing protein [Chitinophaga cymbidii]|uniref:Uncharacterized protein n=1 Tax=Chitinophaga cymbidii TaxID=1096750 RepID=A0A512RQL5_9BACT|nr:carboxypeptidase-like regulatory domain-containing protein [Chitinophaga cymbidii]GEP97975.1 hypothetical protein CCY01nite_42350 [Chitinophaga cymbidii]